MDGDLLTMMEKKFKGEVSNRAIARIRETTIDNPNKKMRMTNSPCTMHKTLALPADFEALPTELEEQQQKRKQEEDKNEETVEQNGKHTESKGEEQEKKEESTSEKSTEEGSGSEAKKESRKRKATTISFVAETLLPTRTGHYRILAYRDLSKQNSPLKNDEILCVVWGKVEGQKEVPVRVHDACFTSEVLGSLKCDCKEQLDFAMQYIKSDETENPYGCGMVIYMMQEGRGIGLANKIKAYSMQEKGYDTVDANRVIGFADDLREYDSVPQILAHLNIESIALLTNNPRKLTLLTDLGVNIAKRIPITVITNPHNQGYLTAKQNRMGHLSQY